MLLEKLKKLLFLLLLEKIKKVVVFTTAEKVSKVVVFTTAENVSKVVVFSGDSVVGCGVNVKTIKIGKKRLRQKEEDVTDNNGARKGEETPNFSWVKREELITYEGIHTEVERNKRSNLCENWAIVTQMGSVEILHEILQVDEAAAKSVVATRVDEVRVEILRT
ncbi:hypothetical protein V8G54_009554 [Vigna mungo]|uniref:Uncharacterized protein n=1 Tax=Vigna mungo TaxID=3915 RepID=A0AAQ3NX01_VIGMU